MQQVIDRQVPLSSKRHVLNGPCLRSGFVSQLDIIRVKLRKLVEHLVVDKLAHILQPDVRKADEALWSHNKLVVDDAGTEVPLLLDVELYVVLRRSVRGLSLSVTVLAHVVVQWDALLIFLSSSTDVAFSRFALNLILVNLVFHFFLNLLRNALFLVCRVFTLFQ